MIARTTAMTGELHGNNTRLPNSLRPTQGRPEPVRASDFPSPQSEAGYSLDSPKLGPNKKPMFFGAAVIKKNYVSFHLMPVYVHPELLEGISDGLRKRMQGKSCFNFKALDEDTLVELRQLTERGFEAYRQDGLV